MPSSNPVNAGSRVPLTAGNIPTLLRDIDRWVMWKAGTHKPNGKFDKVPVNSHGRKVNGLAAENWLSFQDALTGYSTGKCDGVGFVLNGGPVTHGADQLYLVALDFDNCEASESEMKQLWLKLGKPYLEVSPSGKGLRMFVLSRVALKGGNDGHGHEMYFDRRFVTVTGNSSKGKICEATDQLLALHEGWFPKNSLPAKQRARDSTLGRKLAYPDTPESAEAIAQVNDMLRFIPASCSRDMWRNIVWAVFSTGWTCAVDIARQWSMTDPKKYEDAAFNRLVQDYKPEEGITLATLYHHAKSAGWTAMNPPPVIDVVPVNPPAPPSRLNGSTC